jgi:hypothetical protein
MTWILPRQLHTLAYALDTGALSLDSSEQSQICAQSLFVRSKPSPSAIWLRKWKRDLWTQHLSGRILRPSLGKHFVTAWTSSLGDIPASPSAQPVSAKESKTRGTYGRGLQMAFDFSDPGSASLRTSKDISAWGCPTSSKTWQEWVTERRGAYSARLKSAHRTSESGCSSWPTAAARDFRDTGDLSKSDFRKDGKLRKDVLPRAVSLDQRGYYGPAVPASSSTDGSRPRLWQTATVSTGAHRQKDGGMIDKLDQQVKSWATPDASDRRSDKSRQVGLSNQMKSEAWPTPASAGVTGGPTGLAGGAGNREKLASMLPDAEARAMGCGKLNPRWVETLMGLPVGWTMPSCASPVTIEQTNFGYSATVLSQQQHTERFAHSSKS